MLDHFHVEDHVEFFARICQRLCGGGAIIDIEAALGCMDFRHFDIGGGGVRADHGCAQARHRFAEQPAAAANVEKAKTFQRARRVRVAVELRADLFLDIGKPCRIEFVQRAEFTLRIPPLRGDARKMLDLGSVDGGAGSLGHLNLLQQRPPAMLSR
ncbi:hypothetical protein BAA13334_I01002 [Brucella abortus A13334]|nr:hypothetical protein BAA13334_I01002 [Brucella abortus A13334]